MAVRLNPKTGQLESYDEKKEIFKPFTKAKTAEATPTETKPTESAAEQLARGKRYIMDREKLAARAGVDSLTAGLAMASGQDIALQERLKQNRLNETVAANAGLAGQIGQGQDVSTEVPQLTEWGIESGALPDIGSKAALNLGAGAAGTLLTANPIPLIASLGKTMTDAISEVSQEYQQETAVQYAGFTQSQKVLSSLINDINQNPQNAARDIDLYNYELSKIEAYERNLLFLEKQDWLSKAKKNLIKVQNFKSGQMVLLNQRLAEAITTPDPNKILDMTIYEMGEVAEENKNI